MLLVRNWWLIALRGISSILFSLYFFLYPDLTIEILAKGFCFYAFADGAFCILVALLTAKHRAWRAIFLIIGLLGLTAGLLTLYQPIFTAVLLLVSIGPWVIFTGALEIIAGYVLKKEFESTGWLRIAGIVSLIIGGYIMVQPFVGFPSLATLIGTFQIVRGIINLLISFGIRHNRKELEAVINA
jgi:uncharacterized membrane protein HdeD (DUF308 family)